MRPQAMSGGIVFLIFLGYFIGLGIASNIIIHMVGFGGYFILGLLFAVAATVETVQRRAKYGPASASHPVLVFIVGALGGLQIMSLYMADFHRHQARLRVGWYNYPTFR
jgi:hypothetical protein